MKSSDALSGSLPGARPLPRVQPCRGAACPERDAEVPLAQRGQACYTVWTTPEGGA